MIDGDNDTDDKFFAGINDTGQQSPVTTALAINFSPVSTSLVKNFIPAVVVTGDKIFPRCR
jgi:hypothetical protein